MDATRANQRGRHAAGSFSEQRVDPDPAETTRRGRARTSVEQPRRRIARHSRRRAAVARARLRPLGDPGQTRRELPRRRRAALAGHGIEGIASDEVEAGWWVTEERRREGIATEAMEAAIDDLWGRTDVESITAYIEEGANEPSRRVAAKLGFAARGPGRGRSGEPMTVYEVRRDDWLRRGL